MPVRKLGKLPSETIGVEYELEYGTNTLEVHRDAVTPAPARAHRRRPARHGRHRHGHRSSWSSASRARSWASPSSSSWASSTGASASMATASTASSGTDDREPPVDPAASRAGRDASSRRDCPRAPPPQLPLRPRRRPLRHTPVPARHGRGRPRCLRGARSSASSGRQAVTTVGQVAGMADIVGRTSGGGRRRAARPARTGSREPQRRRAACRPGRCAVPADGRGPRGSQPQPGDAADAYPQPLPRLGR